MRQGFISRIDGRQTCSGNAEVDFETCGEEVSEQLTVHHDESRDRGIGDIHRHIQFGTLSPEAIISKRATMERFNSAGTYM